MSGPKSSEYQVDPQVLRERMLEAEHQRNMANIRNEACRKADLLFSQMKSAASSVNTFYENESNLSEIRNLLEKVSKAQSDGASDDRLTSMRNELLKFGADLSDSDKRRIEQINLELVGLLSKEVYTSVGRVVSEIPDQSQNSASKATQFDEEQRKKRFRMAAEELFAEAALLEINEYVPEYDSENSEKLIEQMQQRTEELQKIREKNIANAYIYSTALRVMKEMGYNLLGEKQANGNISLRSSLFQINDTTAFNFTQSSDGSIVYEVVGINNTGDLSVELTDEIEKIMLTMCESEYEKFLKMLALRGITPAKKHRRLPPSRQFATAKNLQEYSLPNDDTKDNTDTSISSKRSISDKKVTANRKKDGKAQYNGTN